MIWFTFAGVLAVIVWYLVIKNRSATKLTIKASVHTKVKAGTLSIEKAKTLVDEIISTREQLIVEAAPKSIPPLKQLGPISQDFFSIYNTIRTPRGDFEISATQIHPSEYTNGYISIGHSEDWDVVQRPGEDEVFVVEGSETHVHEMEVRFQSIYHLLLDEVGDNRKQ